MRTLFYSIGVSADGYINDAERSIDWTAPDEELHRFHNDKMARTGVQLLGRRLYEEMLVWEQTEWETEIETEFARLWEGVERVVFSRTLDTVVGSARLATRSLAEEVAALKAQPGDPIAVGGAGLAGECIRLGLVDEFQLFVYPILLGGGTPALPPLGARLQLRLAETRTFASKVVYLRYVRA